ncbi:rod shape-determining protein RodA [Granulicella tundricola]|uniref:Peptidoglycan glycosyltransferase RodA n=1 Tax=Granulicella tundricola (strain ATCC BAA-1859 / DSM 23138 / MP5ACTX9) TaxID=1198114 RepID=E8X1P3_GRATM|nr:rod shape-determining protein RodA [Granulicella tundricola]ADW67962.1 rod shape-determining protein RodA [Granulicella tundricola MP5ACTX9]
MQRFSSFRDFDWTLLSLIGVLSVMSVLEIKSATLMTKFRGFDHKQILFLLGGMALMFVISLVDYHRLLDIAPWAYGVGFVALVAVKVVGTKVLGARRWIKLPGGIHFQPSEWVKLILILTVARFFWARAGRDLTWTDIFKVFALVGVPLLLVLSQPDLGTSLTYVPVLVIGLFLGGISWKQAGILILAFLLVGGAVVKSGKVLKPYQVARLTSFMDPDNDPKGSGYQIRQSKIAVGSGGIWGKGTNRGTQTQGDFLPIPYTDFIFAALSEEHGFIGAVVVLLLYFLILMRLIQNAQTASDLPGTFIVMGVVAVLVFQIAVNVGMVVGLMPVTGIPLPLLSYGGSSVLFTFLALGIVMNIRMRRFVN